MKAYEVSALGVTSIVPSLSAAKAKYQVFNAANDVGYGVKFSDITIRRRPDLDSWAVTQKRTVPRCPEIVAEEIRRK